MNQRLKLPELSFIGGDSQVIELSLYNIRSQHVTIDGMTATLYVTSYVNSSGTPILTKTGVPKSNDTSQYFQFTLSADDTIALDDKYLYQISIKDVDGNTEVYQGFMTIFANINQS